MSNPGIRGFKRGLLFTTALAGAIASAMPASAEIETVVVTAQLRVENPQSVPVSLQVFSADQLKQQNIQNLNGISDYSPSVHVAPAVANNDIYMRGIGSGTNPSFDQAVGTFIDRVYYGRSRVTDSDLFDLDRVEVLKGPQTTFFGNNAIAGAFNIVTKDPGDTIEGYVRALYGTYADRVVEAAGSLPIADGFSARVAVHYDGTNGFLRNVPTGASGPNSNNIAGRITLRYQTEDLDMKLKAQAADNDLTGSQLQPVDCPPPAPIPAGAFCAVDLGLGLGGDVGLDKNRNIGLNQGVHRHAYDYVYSADYKHWGQTFSLVASYTNFTYSQSQDADATPKPLILLYLPENNRQESVEFRVASPTDQTIEYVAGVYAQADWVYSDRQLAYAFLTPNLAPSPVLGPLVANGPLTQVVKFWQAEHSYAAFGAVTWHVTDQFSVVGGMRYSNDHKSIYDVLEYGNLTGVHGFTPFSGTLNTLPTAATGNQHLASLVGLGPAGTYRLSRNDDAVQPSAKLQYKVNDDVMVYFSYGRGYLAGGFNGTDATGNPANVPYKPEFVNDYEFGFKSLFFNNRVLFNLNLFRGDYSALQVQQYQSLGANLVSLVKNAASVTSQGVEFQGAWYPTESFDLTTNITYLNSAYNKYTGVGLTELQTFCHANPANPSCIATFGGDPGATQNLTGRPTAYAPQWSGNLTAAYHAKFDGYELTPYLSAIFSSKYFPEGPGTDDPLLIQPGYLRLDAGLTIAQLDSGLAFDIIGKNLTDQNILTSSTLWPATNGSHLSGKEEPRSIAFQVRYAFQ